MPRPPGQRDYASYSAALVRSTVDAVERGQIPRGQYGAVLIDEGHDFEPDWFRRVAQMVDPATNSLLLLYDDAQSIYTKGRRKKFSFARVGIQAQGRTTILRLNYRNTVEILSVAKAFAEELLNPEDADEDGVPVIAPESAGRRGPIPELIRCASANDEAGLIAERISHEQAQGRSLSDIAVLLRFRNQAQQITQQLGRRGIAYRLAAGQDGKRALFEGEPSVKLFTLHSSKGLKFGATFIPRLCEIGKSEDEQADEARLLYVGMTRATERLVLTHVRAGAFCARVQAAITAVGAAA